MFSEYNPGITDEASHFVAKERVWVTVTSPGKKTAVCGGYVGVQQPNNCIAGWNEKMYSVLHSEAVALRAQGFRVVFLADFNGHIGCEPGLGIEGNNPDVNFNGQLLLDFLDRSGMVHINGVKSLTKGLWTRQR